MKDILKQMNEFHNERLTFLEAVEEAKENGLYFTDGEFCYNPQDGTERIYVYCKDTEEFEEDADLSFKVNDRIYETCGHPADKKQPLINFVLSVEENGLTRNIAKLSYHMNVIKNHRIHLTPCTLDHNGRAIMVGGTLVMKDVL